MVVTPSLRQPTWDDVHDIVRRCGFTPGSAETLGRALVDLVPEIEAEMAVPEADRRARRREKISALEAAASGSRRLVDAFETARPAGAAALRNVLGRDIGQLFSSAAYARL